MSQWSSVICRILFIGSFLLAALAVWEKLANLSGFTLLRGYYDPSRLLELGAVGLIFVIALQLREIKVSLGTKGST
jgi:hypothetical protein